MRDGLAALLVLSLGAALAVPILTQTWPQSALPPLSGGEDYEYNLRLLKLMLAIEGLAMMMLAPLVLWNGAWLRRLGGVQALDDYPRICLLLVCLSHLGALAFFMSPNEILSEEPVHTASHAQQYYQIFTAHHLLEESGHTSGYDPFFMAGYPAGVSPDPDSRGAELFAHFFSFIGLAYASKVYILLVQFLVPIFIYACGRLLRLGRGEALLAAFLALLYWHWGRPYLGYLRWNGMHSYLLACLLALSGICLFARFFDDNHRVRAACYGFLLTCVVVIGYIQPAGYIILALPLLLSYIMGFQTLRRRDHLALALALGLVLLLHGPWLARIVRLRGLLPTPGASLQLLGVGELAAILLRPSSIIMGLMLIFGLAGIRRLHKREALGTAALLVTLLSTWGMVAYGAQVPGLRRLETARFLVPGGLVLSLMAAPFLDAMLRQLQAWFGTALIVVALFVSLTLPPFLSILDTRFYYVHRIDATIDPRFQELMLMVQNTPPVGSRVLFESMEHGWLSREAGSAALQSLVPIHTKRELIAGSQFGAALPHARLNFGAGQLMGRPFAAWSEKDFAAFLDRYNIGTAVAWSSEARNFLARNSLLLETVDALDGVVVFRVREASGPVALGHASVRTGYNRIELTDLQGEELILRYHWDDALEAIPPVPIERVEIPEDPIGFVRVRPQGADRILLRYKN